MASLAKDVSLSLGLITAVVRVESAVVPQESLNQLCIGQDHPHDPRRITMPVSCPECGAADRTRLVRGRQVGKDNYVIVTPEELAEIDDSAEYKGKIELTPHPMADVVSSTRPGDKAYWLIPQGDAGAYHLFAALLAESDDTAYCALYTIRTAVAMYRLTVQDGALLLRELVATPLRSAPEVAGSLNADLLPVAREFAKDQIKPFDPATYRDGYTERLDALLADREVVAVASSTKAPTASEPSNLMEALKAAVAEQKPKRTRTRKAA